MPQMEIAKNWHDLYEEALTATDPAKLPALIEEAYRAAQDRALELWNARSPETKERHELDSAIYFLRLLKMAAEEEVAVARATEMLAPIAYES